MLCTKQVNVYNFEFESKIQLIKPKCKSEWTSLGTISTMENIKGYPMVNVVSVADSIRGEKSTGDIYFYVLKVDPLFMDLKHKNKITALFSDEQSLTCSKRGLDPMEPTCSRIMITGYVAQVRYKVYYILSKTRNYFFYSNFLVNSQFN